MENGTDEQQNYEAKVNNLRQKFESAYHEELRMEVYDDVDLERVGGDDMYMCCFLRHHHGDTDKAAAMMDAALRWRKALGVNELNQDSFPRHLHEGGSVFYHNHDKQGQQILHIRVSKHRKNPETNLRTRQYMAWQIDKAYTQSPGRRIVVLFDMTDASLSNVDLELIKFQIACFTTYYPSMLAYMLIFEMPWVLNAIWVVIKKLLTASQQKYVLMVKKGQIGQYIDSDQLLVHMGGTDGYTYAYLPSKDSGVEVPNGDSDTERSLVSSGEYTPETSALRKRVTFDIPRSKSCGNVYDMKETDAQCAEKNQKSSVVENCVHTGSLASIRPGEKISFLVSEGRSVDTVAHITISNITDRCISYKVKTTSPDVYRVRPHTGIIEVNECTDVNVTLLAGRQSVAKDKFLVMIMSLSGERETSSAALNALWKSAAKESPNYMEHRLSCDTVHMAANETLLMKTVTKSAVRNDKALPSDLSMSEKIDELLQRQVQIEFQLAFLLKLQLFTIVALLILIIYAVY